MRFVSGQEPQRNCSAQIIKDQDIPDGCMPTRYKRLVKLIGRRVEDGEQPGKPPFTIPKLEGTPIRQSQNCIAKHMPTLFDDPSRPTKVRQIGGSLCRKHEDDAHHKERRQPAEYNSNGF